MKKTLSEWSRLSMWKDSLRFSNSSCRVPIVSFTPKFAKLEMQHQSWYILKQKHELDGKNGRGKQHQHDLKRDRERAKVRTSRICQCECSLGVM